MEDNEKYYLYLTKETGLLLIWFTKNYRFEGTYEQCLKEFKKVQRHNHIWGWWSGLGPFKVMKYSKGNKAGIESIQAERKAAGLSV